MIDLNLAIVKIERLLSENTLQSLTYAALECRLAIERICYERLRAAHDYISHDDIKRWQPRDVVNVLLQEVDAHASSTFTVSISTEPWTNESEPPTREDYDKMEFIPVGTQVGFDPVKLGILWNALSSVALHIRVPKNKGDEISQYGEASKIRKKISEALEEIKNISGSNLSSSGIGEEISFGCSCGTENRRRLSLLTEGQVVSCVNPHCRESYCYEAESESFVRRVIHVTCQNCHAVQDIPMKRVERLNTNKQIYFDCNCCHERIRVVWRLMQGQKVG